MEGQKNILNGRYELISGAGTGGMATVYKAKDLMLGRIVAVKMLHEGLTSDEEFLRRFQKEAHAAANLSHPNIVTVHDIGQDGRRYFIVMEYIEGLTLKQLIRQQHAQTDEPLHLDRALDISIQICAGIGYAHRAKLVHCDVKSQNVLVTSDGRVKVADFGIARAFSDVSLPDANVIWGTPQYFAPEQAAGEPATPASDVYSIGIIMFEMLTGKLPFEADTPDALALKHMHEPPPSICVLNPLVPQQLERIVNKVLAKEPAGRYRTADQLGRVLISYRESGFEETGAIQPVVNNSLPISERPTEIHYSQRPKYKSPEITRSSSRSVAPRSTVHSDPVIFLPAPDETGPDRMAIVLGILAVISLLGLCPLWYLVYLQFIK